MEARGAMRDTGRVGTKAEMEHNLVMAVPRVIEEGTHAEQLGRRNFFVVTIEGIDIKNNKII
jgi:hypothetical protein